MSDTIPLKQLTDLNVGDDVALITGGIYSTTTIHTITRVSPTGRRTVAGRIFNTAGLERGQDYRWCTRIAVPTQSHYKQMYLERARELSGQVIATLRSVPLPLAHMRGSVVMLQELTELLAKIIDITAQEDESRTKSRHRNNLTSS